MINILYGLNKPMQPLRLYWWISNRSSPPKLFLGKGVVKICYKFTGEHPCRSAISMKLCNFIEITLRHECSPVKRCIFLEHLFVRTLLEGCSCCLNNILKFITSWRSPWSHHQIVSYNESYCLLSFLLSYNHRYFCRMITETEVAIRSVL